MKTAARKYKQEIVIILMYLVYLLVIPLILRFLIPCLGNSDASVITKCNVQLVLDKTIIVILFGFVITSLTYYILLGRGKVKQTIVISLILLILSISAYYVYLITLNSKAFNNSVILTAPEGLEHVELKTNGQN